MPKPVHDEQRQSLYETTLQECLRGELRLVNAGLPECQKRLSALLKEEFPHVACKDGSTHCFKRSEIEYLASLLGVDEQSALALPMLIEIGADQSEAAILCQGELEQEVISRVLAMPVTCQQGRIRIHRPQLALLRKKLKTTTVYVFSPQIVGQVL